MDDNEFVILVANSCFVRGFETSHWPIKSKDQFNKEIRVCFLQLPGDAHVKTESGQQTKCHVIKLEARNWTCKHFY